MTPGRPLESRLHASHDVFLAERPAGADEDVHMVRSLVDHVIDRCTPRGGTVLDPFAGFGTTLDRAVASGRRAIGVELLPERVALMRERVPSARVIEGDARELLVIAHRVAPDLLDRGVDLVLTSPPYMTRAHHEADPLTAYERDGGDYDRYLAELGFVAGQCARIIAPGGYVVWNVGDIVHRGVTTHLIADCARVLEQHLSPVQVTEVVWDRLPHDLVADALLVFRSER